MVGKFRVRVPFQLLVAVPFVLLILLAGGFTGYLSFQNGQMAVLDLAGDLGQEITNRISQQLDYYLSVPILANQENLDAIRLGEFDVHNPDAVEQTLLAQLLRLNTLTSIAYANEQREYIEPLRNILGTDLSIGKSSAATNYALTIYDLTPGKKGNVIASYPDYDPRDRPWYQAPVQAGRQVWSPIYVWKSGYLGIDAGVPVYNADHRLVGVLSASLTLDSIHACLKAMKISETGEAFIVDRSGFLVASSTVSETLQRSGEEPRRISVEEAPDPVLQAAFRALKQESADAAASVDAAASADAVALKNFTGERSYQFKLSAQTYLARASSYQDAYGLDWLIITVIPLSDLMAPMVARSAQTIGVIALSVLASVIVSILIAVWITRPLLRLNESARAIANGDWKHRVQIDHADEIGELASSFNDMAEWVQTSFEAIQMSEKRYQSLFEESPISLWQEDFSVVKQHLDELRARGITNWADYFDQHPEEVRACAAMVKVVDVNQATLHMFESSTKDVFFGGIVRFFTEKTFPFFQHEIVDLANGSRSYETDTVHQTLSGSEIIIHIKLSIPPGHEDTWSRLLIAIEDITQRKRAESALHESETIYRRAIEASNAVPYQQEIVYDKDVSGRFVYTFLGDGIRQLTGYDPSQFSNDFFDSIVLENYAVDEFAKYPHDEAVELVRTGVIPYWKCEYLIRARDGQLRWVLDAAVDLYDENGKSKSSIGLYLDITQRKQAEIALRKSEERFSKAFQASPLMVTITRLEDAVFLEVNEAFEEHTGFTGQDAVGRSSIAIGLWANPAERNRIQQELLANGKIRNHEVVFLTKDGRRLNINLSAELLELEGEKCVLATMEDITERKRAEAHVLRLNRLYATISQINEAIVRASDRDNLFSLICRVAIDYGQFSMAWIGLVDGSSDLVVPVAAAGSELAALNDMDIRYRDEYRGAGVVGRAIRAGRCAICQDITGDPGMAAWRESALSHGYHSVAAVPFRSQGSIIGALAVYAAEPNAFDAEDEGLLDQISGDLSFAIDSIDAGAKRKQAEASLVTAYDTTLEGWAKALELKDNETVGHSRRVIEKTVAVARVLGVPEDELVHIRRGAILHDIGKMGIPDQILHKNGPLTGEERQVMMKHPQTAFDFLSSISYLQKAIDIPYCHHEKWDGTGYPRGLQGTQIPLAARIFAVVDVWDALSSDRPYRSAWPAEAVLNYLRSESGRHFDPQVVEAFMQVIGG
jgi:PAS domain S-box-containing protein/putative nucleotidyltransferase with HDIG domain